MITVQSLSKTFGPVQAVKNLSLSIERGEFYCLLGPNGAGKTTTIKMLTGLMKPTRGTITINGLDVEKDYVSIKKILGLIPDTPFLYGNLTLYEFLEFVREVFDLEREEFNKKTAHYVDLFKLEPYANTLIKELSHGTRQKIVYIANLVHNPLVYLIDEPLVGLDPYSIHLIKKLLRQEVQEGKTILMCTHILSIAEELADKIGILYQGSLIAQGSPQELKDTLRTDSLENVFLELTQDS
jgi:ABC-2 type transport system ATP-binding protein